MLNSPVANKRERHDTILEIVNARVVSSQEDLRKMLLQRGWDVTQATLSRDLRELRLARVPTAEGARYGVTDGTILIICRSIAARDRVMRRIKSLAGEPDSH